MTKDSFIEDLLHKLAEDSDKKLSYAELRRMYHHSIPTPLKYLEQAYNEGYIVASSGTTECPMCGCVHNIKED